MVQLLPFLLPKQNETPSVATTLGVLIWRPWRDSNPQPLAPEKKDAFSIYIRIDVIRRSNDKYSPFIFHLATPQCTTVAPVIAPFQKGWGVQL